MSFHFHSTSWSLIFVPSEAWSCQRFCWKPRPGDVKRSLATSARLLSHCSIPHPIPLRVFPTAFKTASVANTPTAATPPAIASKYLGSSPFLGWNWKWHKVSKRLEHKSCQWPSIKESGFKSSQTENLADYLISLLLLIVLFKDCGDLNTPKSSKSSRSCDFWMPECMPIGMQCTSMTHDVQGMCKDTIKCRKRWKK